MKKTYNGQEKLEKDKGGLQQQIDEKEEEAKIRARKHESELNQERIKLESVNRKLNIHENQAEENKANLAMYYEQNLSKDKKISQMEIKLKDYKYRIQVLRKEKHDIENTYEHKLSTLQPEDLNNALRISGNTLESKNS